MSETIGRHGIRSRIDEYHGIVYTGWAPELMCACGCTVFSEVPTGSEFKYKPFRFRTCVVDTYAFQDKQERSDVRLIIATNEWQTTLAWFEPDDKIEVVTWDEKTKETLGEKRTTFRFRDLEDGENELDPLSPILVRKTERKLQIKKKGSIRSDTIYASVIRR